MEFIGQLKNPNNELVANELFVLTILEKSTEKRLKFSQERVTVL